MPGYRQCTLRQPLGVGDEYREYVAYIPASLAREGKSIGIDGMPGWWTVVEVGPLREDDEVMQQEKDARRGMPSGGAGRLK